MVFIMANPRSKRRLSDSAVADALTARSTRRRKNSSLTSHIQNSVAQIFAEHPDRELTAEEQVIQNTIDRYRKINAEPISQEAVIQRFKAEMQQDDAKEEFDLNSYEEIFSAYPEFPLMPLDLIDLFFEAGVSDKDSNLMTRMLLRLINTNHLDATILTHASYFIQVGADLNFQGTDNPENLTLIHLAILREHTKIAQHMVEAGAERINYSLQDIYGRNVIILAAKMRQTNLLLAMLKHSHAAAILNITDTQGRNALHYAYLLGNKVAVQALLATGKINTLCLDSSGRTPQQLLLAGQSEIIEVLNSVGIDERRHAKATQNYFAFTLKMSLRLNEAEHVARNLISAKFRECRTAVTDAMRQDDEELIDVLHCSENAEYVKQFRSKILRYKDIIDFPKALLNYWKSEESYLINLISNPLTLLQACVRGQQELSKERITALTFALSSLVINSLFAQSDTSLGSAFEQKADEEQKYSART
jgi:ankyrin repeat protein